MRARDSDVQSTIISKFLQDQEKIVALLCNELPLHEGDREAPKWWQGWDTWRSLVSWDNDSGTCVCIVQALLNELAAYAKRLAYCKDSDGNTALDIATQQCREELEEAICFFLKRYLMQMEPVRTSSTSMVYWALDYELILYAEEPPPEMEPRLVMLKFMTDRGEFEREVAANRERVKGEGVGKSVVGYMAEYNSDVDAEFAEAALDRGLGQYCVVMERAVRCGACPCFDLISR